MRWEHIPKGMVIGEGSGVPMPVDLWCAVDEPTKGRGCIQRREGDDFWLLTFWMPGAAFDDCITIVKSKELTLVEAKQSWEREYANAYNSRHTSQR